MIKITRVDHRLLHGQVAFAWIQAVGANCILIANDDVASNELRMAALRMAKPAGVKLVMKSIDDSAEALNSGVTDKYDLFIIVETIADAYRLASLSPCITKINIGGARPQEDRKRISAAVCISDDDQIKLRALVDEGRRCYVQQVPSESPIDILELM